METSETEDGVAAHLRGMRSAPTSKKDTLKLRENSETNIMDQTLNYLPLDFFLTIVHIYGFVSKT